MTSFMTEIYAVITWALDIWVICNENNIANFIAAVLDAPLANLEDPNIKISRGSNCPGPY